MPPGWPGILALLCAVPAQVTFRTDVSLVSIAARVTNLAGHDVRGLTAADFTVLEDGRPRKISFFAAEEQPISLAVLLDESSSMRSSGRYRRAKTALARLFNASVPGSQLLLGEFSDRMESFTEVAADGRPQSTLFKEPAQSGGTALYDSISFALCMLRSARFPRQVLVVATDGADQHSRLRLAELIEVAQASRAQIFVLGYLDPWRYATYKTAERRIPLPDGREMDNPLYVFDRLAKETGADAYYPHTESSLWRAIDAIRQSLATQYSLGYYLQPSPNRYRRIEVKVKRFGVKVRARRGFSATEPGEAAPDAAACAVTAKNHPYPYETRLKTAGDGLRVYRDDFNDPGSGWPIRDDFYYRGGAYHILKVASYDATTLAYGPWWENFRASVSVSFSGEVPADSAAGLVFRLNDAAHLTLGNSPGYYALVLSAGRRGVKLFRWIAQQGTADLLPWTDLPPGPVRLGVECRDDEIRVLVGDRVVGVVRDRALNSGRIGLLLSGRGHAEFRDLVVEDLEASH